MRLKAIAVMGLIAGLMVPVASSVARADIANDPDAARAVGKLLMLANTVSKQDMGSSKWANYVQKIQQMADDANANDVNTYLNDKLTDIGAGVKSNNLDSIKKLVYWVGLYNEFNAQPPGFVYDLAKGNEATIDDLAANFSWDRLAKMIRDRANR